MSDIRLKEYSSLEGVTMDWLMRATGELDDREELATAVRVALGTDAMADVDEILPDPDSTDRSGWWGDMDAEIWDGWAPLGCKNWLLTRAKITDVPSYEGSTLERAKQYTLKALQPFIDRRIGSHVDVVATRTELQRIEVRATIYRGPLAEIELRYQVLWEEETFTEDTIPEKERRIVVPVGQLRIDSSPPIVFKGLYSYTCNATSLVASASSLGKPVLGVSVVRVLDATSIVSQRSLIGVASFNQKYGFASPTSIASSAASLGAAIFAHRAFFVDPPEIKNASPVLDTGLPTFTVVNATPVVGAGFGGASPVLDSGAPTLTVAAAGALVASGISGSSPSLDTAFPTLAHS